MRETDTESSPRGVDVAGPSGGDPIVFLHGVMFTRKLWAPQREALADEFRVVVPDLPGHGTRSDETFRFDQAVEVVRDVIEDVAGGRATVVGISLGGYVATAVAHRYPEMVETLVISGSSANPVGTLETLTRAVSKVSRAATERDLIDRGVRWLIERWVRSRDLPASTTAEIVDGGIHPAQFGEAGFELAGRDVRAALAAFSGPTLILNGRWDLLNRLAEKDHAAAAPRADLDVIDGAGHVVNLDEPAEYVAAIRRTVRAQT